MTEEQQAPSPDFPTSWSDTLQVKTFLVNDSSLFPEPMEPNDGCAENSGVLEASLLSTVTHCLNAGEKKLGVLALSCY